MFEPLIYVKRVAKTLPLNIMLSTGRIFTFLGPQKVTSECTWEHDKQTPSPHVQTLTYPLIYFPPHPSIHLSNFLPWWFVYRSHSLPCIASPFVGKSIIIIMTAVATVWVYVCLAFPFLSQTVEIKRLDKIICLHSPCLANNCSVAACVYVCN